ncbi:hypothetical protein L7F22_057462 [Adiantum nelumboides]|nr:hypothetical protein [Adiantum nelumboides]
MVIWWMSQVMDPSYKEELVMKGRLTVIMNIHGDICAIQKGGGVGVSSAEIMRCLRIASTKVADITSSLKKAADAHETERAFRKVKRHKVVSGIELRKVEVSGTIKADIEMRDAILDRAMKPKAELSDSEDSSSEDSDDDSGSEDKVLGVPRVVKQEDAHAVLAVESIFQGGASKWDEDVAPLVSASTAMSLGKAGTKSSSKSRDEKPALLINAVKKSTKRKKNKKNMGKQP